MKNSLFRRLIGSFLIIFIYSFTQSQPKSFELPGTYYNFKTGEYITINNLPTNISIQYSNGTSLFNTVKINEIKAGKYNCSQYDEHVLYYNISISGHKEDKLLFSLSIDNGGALNVFNKYCKALGGFNYVSNFIYRSPDYLRIIKDIGLEFKSTDKKYILSANGYSRASSYFEFRLSDNGVNKVLVAKSVANLANTIILEEWKSKSRYKLIYFKSPSMKYGDGSDRMELILPNNKMILLTN